MSITIKEFLDMVKTSPDLFLLITSEIVVYDRASKIAFIPEATHYNNKLRPISDLRTHIGHSLLWSQHIEIDCTSDELGDALCAEGYKLAPYEEKWDYKVFRMGLEQTA
jgi:hypothetical protein